MLMIQMVRTMLRNEKGQGMVEYGLILALISVAAIVMMTSLGGEIGTVFTSIKTSLGAAL